MALSKRGPAWARKSTAFVGLLVVSFLGAGIGDPITVGDLLRTTPAFVLFTALIYGVV